MNSLYKKYPCPAQGHLDITVNNPHGKEFHPSFEGEWELIGSKQKSQQVRIHGFKRTGTTPLGSYSVIEVEVTPRSPDSKWYKQL